MRCSPLSAIQVGQIVIELSSASFGVFYEQANAFVYSVQDLRTTESPCGALSRWAALSCDVDVC